MAVLSDAERVRGWRAWMRKNGEPCAFTKTALRAAFDAADQWADDNATSFNSALPTGANSFRTLASTQQKSLLLVYVVLTRAGLLGTEGDP